MVVLGSFLRCYLASVLFIAGNCYCFVGLNYSPFETPCIYFELYAIMIMKIAVIINVIMNLMLDDRNCLN